GELYGRSFHFQALLALLNESAVVADLGCGTGIVSQALAPCARQVLAVDGSPEMLETARGRLASLPNVELRAGELEALPIEDGSVDLAVMMLVLHYIPEPVDALREALRILRPGGKLLVVDMLPHEHQEYQQHMGHVWLGFSEAQVLRCLAQAGFESCRFRPLPPEAEARGPGLFIATGHRAGTGNGALRRSHS
ncbi:MAG TPA: class I SAM-dependent methyltransferase, partial [Armatimonadota bacterium]|nr:class I SAM-dependent methyltransferase [Armatimonadota bacterium]